MKIASSLFALTISAALMGAAIPMDAVAAPVTKTCPGGYNVTGTITDNVRRNGIPAIISYIQSAAIKCAPNNGVLSFGAHVSNNNYVHSEACASDERVSGYSVGDLAGIQIVDLRPVCRKIAAFPTHLTDRMTFEIGPTIVCPDGKYLHGVTMDFSNNAVNIPYLKSFTLICLN